MALFSPALAASITALDGDTFTISGETIRIANLDTPETIQAKCDAERRLGEVAKVRLDQLLHSGAIEIRRGDPADGRMKDRHGRTLAIVSVDGEDVALIMIRESLARPWVGKRQPWCALR